MELIQFPALNCYHACIVTLAQHFGLPCTRAFSRLWAESSLRYDPICGVFLTRRLPRALESMGMALGTPCVTPEARAAAWQSMPPDTFALAGMDAFRIPWTPLFGLQHGPHYFIVRKTGAEQALCFDPTYGLSGQTLPAEALRAGYALIAVRFHGGIPAKPPEPLRTQAAEVLERHPCLLYTSRCV